jgi:hypothetical protein
LGYGTFNFLISIVASSLQKQDTHMRDCLPVKKHVALSLACLGSRDSLMSCKEHWESLRVQPLL